MIPIVHIYVIRLKTEVLEKPRFVEANPDYRAGKPCYYVGSSCHEPQVRFEQHKAGKKASKIVKDFGAYVVKSKCFVVETRDRRAAEAVEHEYAEELRGKGYGVWQH